MIYVAQCVLGFSFIEAWKLTPRQVAGMMRQHVRYRGAAEEQDDEDDDE